MPINWPELIAQGVIGLFQAVIVGLIIFRLDETRALRDRRLADFRIAANWEVSDPKPSLRNFDLTGANLSGYNLSNANLENAILAQTSLWSTNLSSANLRKVNFRKTKLVGVTFTNVIAFYSDFSNAQIRKRSESGTVWIPDFSRANLRGCIFKNAVMTDAIFHDVNFIGADFSGAALENCDFSDADLTDSNWRKVKKAENCIWKNVKGAKPEYFPAKLWAEIQRQNHPKKSKRQD